MQDGSVGHFCFSIGLRIANRREAMLNFEVITEVSEPNVVELTPIVDNEHEQNSKSDNNILFDKFPHLGLGDHSQWLGFHPLGEVVHGHDEESSLCCRHGERTKDIDPPLCEGPWCGDGRQWNRGEPLDIGVTLA